MTFLMPARMKLSSKDPYALALGHWRRTAALVAALWAEFSDAGRDLRPVAFCAYVAALDAEEEAATALRDMAAALPKAA
jgi:hypothetical protein